MAIGKHGNFWRWLRGAEGSDGEHLQAAIDRTTPPHAVTQVQPVRAALIYLDLDEIQHCIKAPEWVRVVSVFGDAPRRAIGLVLEGDMFPLVSDHGVPLEIQAETSIEDDDETVGLIISFPWLG